MGALLPVRHAGHVTAFLGPRKEKKKIPSDHHPCQSATAAPRTNMLRLLLRYTPRFVGAL